MAHLPKQLRAMKRILILLLVLMPLAIHAQDYKYIDFSQTSEDFTRVVTKEQTITNNGFDYELRFCYSKFEYSEMYYVVLICTAPYQWEIHTGDKATFTMADGSQVILNAYMDSTCQKPEDEYIIAAAYKIPTLQVTNMLNAILSLTLERHMNGKAQQLTIPVNHDMASHLMLAYLELLTITGK
jgi:hypothetical protein